MEKINKHMKGQMSNPAEQFRPSHEDVFPRLEEQYWANPNSSRGTIVTTSDVSGYFVKSTRHEGN